MFYVKKLPQCDPGLMRSWKSKKMSTGGGIGGIGMFLLGLGDRGATCTGSKIAKFKYFFLSSKRLYFHVHVCMY